ncbi:hypothetical protein PBAC_09190 [Pedobacter glucosidilyticus]|nr:hypothetical protein PBAC_09190 [Pedobacter glucosidilyticus]
MRIFSASLSDEKEHQNFFLVYFFNDLKSLYWKDKKRPILVKNRHYKTEKHLMYDFI